MARSIFMRICGRYMWLDTQVFGYLEPERNMENMIIMFECSLQDRLSYRSEELKAAHSQGKWITNDKIKIREDCKDLVDVVPVLREGQAIVFSRVNRVICWQLGTIWNVSLMHLLKSEFGSSTMMLSLFWGV